ncbi:UNVERIFIED_CONTAM: Pleiotropic drug resistance protein 1 [Sesamum radiatum]|uniref:Pleiotropic drug resistance protein 1 n=1 Tax=Sesamum radiatum TaxID=300843 RepID=A0AAW2PF18_SESRA
MDRSGLYKASSSLRANSSSFWRNGSLEAFSHSARQEDDEAALKWAALEKLPTYDRLTRGLLVGSMGATSEVDVRNLGIEERKLLLDRLIKAADEDNEKFLLKLRDRIDR